MFINFERMKELLSESVIIVECRAEAAEIEKGKSALFRTDWQSLMPRKRGCSTNADLICRSKNEGRCVCLVAQAEKNPSARQNSGQQPGRSGGGVSRLVRICGGTRAKTHSWGERAADLQKLHSTEADLRSSC